MGFVLVIREISFVMEIDEALKHKGEKFLGFYFPKN